MHVQSMSRAGHRRRKATLRAHSAIGLALLALTHVARRLTTRDTPTLQLCDSWCGRGGCCVTAPPCGKPAKPDAVVLICMCACTAGEQQNSNDMAETDPMDAILHVVWNL